MSCSSDDDWEVVDTGPAANPVTAPQCYIPPYLFGREQLNISISFTVLTNFFQIIPRLRPGCPVPPPDKYNSALLTSEYGEDRVREVLAVANQRWRQASINFNLRRFQQIRPQSTRQYVWGEDWAPFFDEVMTPQRTWDLDAQVNVFLVPYLAPRSLGFTNSWGPLGHERSYLIFLAETHPTTLQTRTSVAVGNTLAHELGHNLELQHNPSRDYLMYYDYDEGGGLLSPDEIRFTRVVARKLKTPRQLKSLRTFNSNTTVAAPQTSALYPNLRSTS